MRILAIETSCDETAIAIAEFNENKKTPGILVLSNLVSSQVKLHAKFGGVVPNLAKREHQKNLVPLLLKALKESNIYSSCEIENIREKSSRQARTVTTYYLLPILEREPELLRQFTKKILPLPVPGIDAIAVTYGPGLAPALWVGVNFARALSILWGKPLIPVNHMEGHLLSALLKQRNPNSQIPISNQIKNQKSKNLPPTTYHLQPLRFPAVALLVSGGHTELVLVRGFGNYKIIGETHDDAAGEAFDKVARILGLPYPGGPAISALAEMEIPISKSQFPKIKLPRPMINSGDFNFSFSGLKTAVLYLARDLSKKHSIKKLRPTIAREFQDAVVEVLVKKTTDAAKKYKTKTVLLGGGVAANKLLREQLVQKIEQNLLPTTYHLPPNELTGDNALMIALAAFLSGKKKAPAKVGADANVKL